MLHRDNALLGHDDFRGLIDSLSEVDRGRGIHLIDRRFRESKQSWSDLRGRARRFAGLFRRQGLEQGDRVLVSLSSTADSIAAFLGLIYSGAIPFSVPSPLLSQDRELHRRRIVDLVKLHAIDFVLASADLAGVGGTELPPTLQDETQGSDKHESPPIAVDPDREAFVQFSSGSTSHPKGVRITHRNLLYNLGLIVANDRRTVESVMVSWLPLCHDMGLVGCLLSNLVLGNNLVLMDPLCFMTRPISWLSAISRMKGTVTAIPNFALDICIERVSEEQLEEQAIDLSTFRYVYNGSEPVNPESIRRFEEKFAPYGFTAGSIYPVYGMSETTLIVCAPPFDDSITTVYREGMEIPAVGRPLGDFEISVRGEDGSILEDGQIGELHIRGTSVTPGYLLSEETGYGNIGDGWLATGDLGFVDLQGLLYVTGRQKDLIIHQGRNYYGHDVAGRIEKLPYVKTGKVFVFSVVADGREQIVVMTAPPRRNFNLTEEESDRSRSARYRREIKKFVLKEFGLPVDAVQVVKQIPKTTSGKFARHLCVEIFMASGKEGCRRRLR